MFGIIIALIIYFALIAGCEAIRKYRLKNGVEQIIEPSMFMDGKVNIITYVNRRGKQVKSYFNIPNDYEANKVRLEVRKEALVFYKKFKKHGYNF